MLSLWSLLLGPRLSNRPKLRTPGGLVNPTPTPSGAGNLRFQQLPEEALTLYNTLVGGPHILPGLQPGKLKTQVRSLGPPSYAKRANGSGSLIGPFAGNAGIAKGENYCFSADLRPG